MKHNESDIIVYQTNNYELFSMVEGNRGLNLKKINKIIKEIEAGNNMLPYYPIQVKINGKQMDILDGQHRYFISQKIKSPIYYILVRENKSMVEIARINSNVEKWTQQNFIDCYINNKNKNYIQLQEFINQFGFNVGTSLQLLATGSPGTEGFDRSLTEKFQDGKFEVKQWDRAVLIAKECNKFSASMHWKDRSFIIAISRIIKAGLVPLDNVVEAFKKNPDMLTKQYSQKNYVYCLEQIVNHGKQKRIVIT